MKKEYMQAFEEWIDENYGDAHPARFFMRNAWEAGVLYGITSPASQEDVEADVRCKCNPANVGFVTSFNGPMCMACGKIRTA